MYTGSDSFTTDNVESPFLLIIKVLFDTVFSFYDSTVGIMTKYKTYIFRV